MNRHDHIHGQYSFAFGRTISTARAAQMLRVSSETVRKMLEDGTLAGYRVRPNKKKSPWLVFITSVEKHIAEIERVYAIGDSSSESNSAKPARSNSSLHRHIV